MVYTLNQAFDCITVINYFNDHHWVNFMLNLRMFTSWHVNYIKFMHVFSIVLIWSPCIYNQTMAVINVWPLILQILRSTFNVCKSRKFHLLASWNKCSHKFFYFVWYFFSDIFYTPCIMTLKLLQIYSLVYTLSEYIYFYGSAMHGF